MDNVISYLEQLQVSPLEAKLYLAIVKAGSITAADLAQKVGINRTQVYPTLDLLFKKGLVAKMVKRSQTHYASLDPKESLPALVTKKEHDLKVIKADLPTMMATVEGLQGEEQEDNEVEIKYYIGKAGVKKIYKEALAAKELRSYVNITEIVKVFPDNAFLFDEAVKENPQMKMFELVEDSPEARKRFTTPSRTESYQYKLLPKGMQLTAQDILIYDDKVAVIHFKDKVSGIIHHDADLADNFRLLFDYIWRTLPE